MEYSALVAENAGVQFVALDYEYELCSMLEACVLGELPDNKQNLLITIPPRHYKTTFVSHNFVSWCLSEIASDCEFLLVSYAAELATANAMRVRNIIQSDWHKELYPDLQLSKEDKLIQKYFRTTEGGSVYAAGMTGSITGFGAGKAREGFGGAIIIDDPIKAADARSAVERRNAIEYYNGTLKSRRNSTDTPIILIMQRLHLEDLAGWIGINEADSWYQLRLPAIRNGELLNPITTSIEELEQLKIVDPVTYYAQYQQEPIVPGGTVIKRSWWTYFDPAQQPSGLKFITADTAFKGKEESDASVLQCWVGNKDGLFLVDACYGRWDFPELLEKAKDFYVKCGEPREFWIEDKASGTPLEQLLYDAGLPAKAWSPNKFHFADDKVSRMQAASWYVHNGRVKLPYGSVKVRIDEEVVCVAPCAAALIEESTLFSRDMSHAHDDHCDAFTMAVSLYVDAGGE